MSQFAYLAGALLLLPAAAFADAPSVQSNPPKAAVTTAAAVAKPDGEKIICERRDTIGSRVQDHLVCLTKDQWTEFRREEQDAIADFQARTRGAVSN